MHHHVFSELEAGAVAITATERHSRWLKGRHTEWQRGRGKSVWPSPAIRPWGAFLRDCWREWLAAADPNDAASAPMLLNPAQLHAVWEDVIASSPEGRTLLSIPAAAAAAMKAWARIWQYRLPLDGAEFAAREDTSAFLGWARAFDARCKRENWSDEARLPDLLAKLFPTSAAFRPGRLMLLGFPEEISPQMRGLLEVIGPWERASPGAYEAETEARAFLEPAQEYRGAATWAREILAREPGAQIGIVVAHLDRDRRSVEREVRAALHPGAPPDLDDVAYSLGDDTLEQEPLAHCALEILALAEAPAPFSRWSALVRSPYFANEGGERSARAQLDANLRRKSCGELAMRDLEVLPGNCPALSRAIGRLTAIIAEKPETGTASHWARMFLKILRAGGWPSVEPLSRREAGARDAVLDSLSRLATLDAVRGPVSYDGALDLLRRLLRQARFHQQPHSAAVQILPFAEAAGWNFDYLWIAGLRDDALPSPARPNPFLPFAMQVRAGLPDASAERAREAARVRLRQLLSCAPRITASYAIAEGEAVAGPTRLIGDLTWLPSAAPTATPWVGSMLQSVSYESLVDERIVPFESTEVQRGGTTLIRDIAACPFRAVVHFRLDARELEDPEPALNPRDKGSAVHRVLAALWGDLQSHEALRELTEDQIAELVRRHVHAALAETQPLGRTLEAIRLEKIVARYLATESRRPKFRVAAIEESREIEVGGMRLIARIDRVDQLEDGRKLIFDYKTGNVNLNLKEWEGERPDAPQVPLYCISDEGPLAGAAFIKIAAGAEGRFEGFVEESALPDLKRSKGPPAPLAERLSEWKRVLNALARQYREGNAAVDPKARKSCEYCGLTALCRRHDRGPAAGDE